MNVGEVTTMNIAQVDSTSSSDPFASWDSYVAFDIEYFRSQV